MEFKNTIDGTIVIIIAVCLICGMLVPIIDGMAGGEPGQTNEGAGWIRMNYDTSASTYTITIAPGEVGITVTNGTDTQAGADDTIFYADSNVAVWMQDGAVNVLGQNTDGPQFFQPLDPVTITRTADSVAIDDGSTTLTFGTPAWAYVPISSGNYGYFEDGTAVATNSPIAAVGGGFAGVYAYNDISRYDLPLQLQTVMEDGKLTGAYWAKPAAADSLSITPLDPGSITIQPLDPSILDPEPDASIMAVPTPTYTDGEWGYNLENIGGVQKAVIVSYSGAGGDIVVPATVGGYEVYRFGKASPTGVSIQVFDVSSLEQNSTITFPDTIKQIGAGACNSIVNGQTVSVFSGALVLPDGITQIGVTAFDGCSFNGSVIIPESCTFIGQGAFSRTTIDTIVFLGNPSSTIQYSVISNSSVKSVVCCRDVTTSSTANLFGNSNLTEFLDLAPTIEYAPSSYGIPATATVSDSIGDSAGYISFVEIGGGGAGFSDSVKGLMLAIPIVILASLLVAVAVAVFKRDY